MTRHVGTKRTKRPDEKGVDRCGPTAPFAISRRHGLRFRTGFLTLLLGASLVASPATADRYDSSDAGHPLRIVAYVLHPVGVILDYLIFRPAHWLGSREPIKSFVGHKNKTEQ